MSSITAHPSLDIVKPGRKEAASSLAFENCIEELFDVSCLNLVNVMAGVFHIDNVLTKNECMKMRTTLDSCGDLSFWSGEKTNESRMFRDAETLEVESKKLGEILWSRIRHLLDIEIDHICIADEDDSDPEHERELVGEWQPIALNHDLLYARYPSLGAFAPHTDGRAIHDFNRRSFYSIIVFLNTIPSGGGTRFYKKEATKCLTMEKRSSDSEELLWTARADLMISEVEPIEGRMLIFHQSLVHEGVPPASPHRKYIIRSDVMFQRSPAVCDSPHSREAYRIFRQAEDLAEAGSVEEATPLFRRALKMSPEMARLMGQG